MGGGINTSFYPPEFNEKFKESVKEKYNHSCVICKLIQEQVDCCILHIHHIDYDKDNLDSDNFVPLCRSCHSTTNGNRIYWIGVLQNIVRMNTC